MNKLYIIHGWTYSTDAWKKCLLELRQKNFEPILLNVPGLTAESDRVWTLDEYVAWLAEVLEHEQYVTLVGHSNGGRIALAFAARYPKKINRLILIDAAGIVHNELPLRIKRAVFGRLAKLGKKVTSSTKARKVFYRLIGARDYERAPEHMRRTMSHLITQNIVAELPHITAKTLILWGKKDTATPIGDAYLMQIAIKGSKLVILAAAGHSPHLTHPSWVATEIATWFAESR